MAARTTKMGARARALVLAALLWPAAGPVSAKPPPPEPFTIPPRSGGLANYPCMQCHDKVEPRDVVRPPPPPHDRLTLAHLPEGASCYTCHDRANLDRLWLIVLARPIPIDEAPQLCGQCHGEKHRDWRLGIHGKQLGGWRGQRQRLGCTDCHDPHAPRRGSMTAVAPPPVPRLLIRKGASHE